MQKQPWFLLLVLFLLTACSGTPPSQSSPAFTSPTEDIITTEPPSYDATETPTALGQILTQETEPTPEISFPGSPLPADRGDLFAASGACTNCHQSMLDEAGQDVSTDTLWRATMLANSARDPYWQATVRSEVNQAPELSTVIQEKCATCHMPMAELSQTEMGEEVVVIDSGLLDQTHPLHSLAMDGISCTLCHQVEPDNFGQADSFSGGYLIDTNLSQGERLSYGPYEPEPNLISIMQGASGYIPILGTHLEQSELCGTCHDLYTPFLDKDGVVAGEFAEQLVYSEWLNSAYAADQSCQSCHMPQAQGGVQLSITGGPLRSPFYQHVFVGGNAYMLYMLGQNGEALGVTASADQFKLAIDHTIKQISHQSARLSISEAQFDQGVLTAEISIENLVGHKFPAGFPSRRVWLHIQIMDPEGNLIFESGRVEENGLIIGNENDSDPTRYEPHYTVLSAPDQVQIYEAIMVNTEDEVTTTLLRGAKYIKDNRLLPKGFQASSENPALAPQGMAAEDENFLPGQDTVQLAVSLDPERGPFTLQVKLLFQTVAYRWAENLKLEQGVEVEQFTRFVDAQPNLPLQAAQAELTLSP